MFAEESLSIGRVTLNVARGPAAGGPLILVHGVVRAWQDFLPLLPTLAVRREVLALDLRGHGRSTHHLAAYRVADYAADLAGLLATLAQPAVIYGHSLGTLVALAAAAEAPRRVAGLVLEDPPLELLGERLASSPYRELFAGWRGFLAEKLAPAELVRRMADQELWVPAENRRVKLSELRDPVGLRFAAHCLSQLDPAVLDPPLAGEWLDRRALDAICGRIECPVLVLQANPALGGMCHAEDAAYLQARLGDATWVALDDVGHLIHAFAPETTLRLVCQFLETL